MNGGLPLIVVAAGGTGGHLFPAEALANALRARGARVDLATDARAARYGQQFPADHTHILPSATFAGRNPVKLARAAAVLGFGIVRGIRLIRKIRPAALVGFGGYPTVPPVLAATLVHVPTVIHEQNGVMGRANRLLASRVTAIATSFPSVIGLSPHLTGKSAQTGNPVRPAVIELSRHAYRPPGPADRFRLLVFGGSQGAKVMADIVPPALASLPEKVRRRIDLVQQAREEDRARVEDAYERAGLAAEIAPFFADLPARMAAAHLVISRSGASTVAELAVVGRPSILVPFPHALDQDQLANATMLAKAGAAILLTQDQFTPQRLAGEMTELLSAPERLNAMAQAAKSAGAADAADRLADLVMKVAGLNSKDR